MSGAVQINVFPTEIKFRARGMVFNRQYFRNGGHVKIAKSDAVTLAGVLQNAIDVPLLQEHFPGQPIQAYFEFSPNLTQETRQVVQDALLLKAAGFEIKPEEISEKTGYTLTVLPDQQAEKKPPV